MMRQEGFGFAKFTERARTVLSLAHEEAQRFNHQFIAPEHLLLGLVREGQGVGAMVLKHMGVEFDQVRKAVEASLGRENRIVLGEIGLTASAKDTIELAVDEARRLNHHYIGTEHLLLGLVREGGGAATILGSLGVDLEKLRTQTIQVLSTTSRPSEETTPSEIRQARGGMLRAGAYQSFHINSEAPDKTAIGAKAQQQTGIGTLLGWVVVNTGGEFTLTLYDGLEAEQPLAIITNPATGAFFPFYTLVGRGLTYTLEGTPGSVTIIYDEVHEERAFP
jgi:hypothetical protein